MIDRTEQHGTRLLHVICTPRGLASNTGRVSGCLLEALREADERLEIETLDLFRADLPSVAGKNIESKYRLITGQGIADDARESWGHIERTIEQFLDADLLGQRLLLDWSASDAESGLATPGTGQATVDTSTVGLRVLTASASDNVGHTGSTTGTVHVIYDFTGYFLPVGNAPAYNKASAGKVVAISFSLGGMQGLSVITAGYPVSAQIACGSPATLTTGLATVATTVLTYAGGRYTYQRRTEKAWAGTCRQFVILLADGTYHRANFAFK